MTLRSFKKYVHSKLQLFDLHPLVHPCLFYMQDTYEFFWKKNWGLKREKIIKFFCRLNIKDGNVFYTDIYIYIYIYIYDNNNNTYMFIYIKKVYAFLIKLSATTKQLIRRNSISCLKNLAIFFRVNIEIGLTPPIPMFVFIRFLRIHPPPQQTIY